MTAPTLYTLLDQHLWLSAQRAIFWEEAQALILSDLHLGKTGHFRKAGIGIPQTGMKEDMQRLLALVQHFQPKQLLVVGDFFHSHANEELALFSRWRANMGDVAIRLIRGNHDILKAAWYRDNEIEVIENSLTLSPFHFSHDRCEAVPGHYSFCGHLHPGVAIHGLGRQSLRFPCFHFAPDHCILPAFGGFTGLATIRRVANDHVYAIVENEIIAIR